MSIQLLDVVLLIEHSGHAAVVGDRLGVRILVAAEVEREIDHALLAVQIFLLKID